MTSAGWYPDPAGAPNTYRYWDGRSWSQATSTDPFGQFQQHQPDPSPAPAPEPPPMVPPAPPIAPTPPTPPTPSPQPVQQTYGALPDPPQWSPLPDTSTPTPPGGSRAGRTIAIVMGAVAFLVLLAIIAFVAVRTLGDDDGAPSAQPPAASDTPTPTEPSIPGTSPSGPVAPSTPLGTLTPTALQCYGGLASGSTGVAKGGVLSGGGLSVPMPKGYHATSQSSLQFPFASGAEAGEKTVSANWASTIAIGGLPKAGGFTGLEQAARTVAACVAANPTLYTGVTGISDLSAKSLTVDGHRAFSLMQNIKVSTPGVSEKGDTAMVVVVDTGNKRSYGVYLMVVPIGDRTYLALQKSTAGQLSVK